MCFVQTGRILQVEVRACFDGISRPEEIFGDASSDDVDNEEDEEERSVDWTLLCCDL